MLLNRLLQFAVVFCIVFVISVSCSFIRSQPQNNTDTFSQYELCYSSPFSMNGQQAVAPCIPSLLLGNDLLYKNYANVLLTKYRRKVILSRKRKFMLNTYESSLYLNNVLQFTQYDEEYVQNLEFNHFLSFFIFSVSSEEGVCNFAKSTVYFLDREERHVTLSIQNCTCTNVNTVILMGISRNDDFWLSSELSPQSIEIGDNNEIEMSLLYRQCHFSLSLTPKKESKVLVTSVTSNVNSTKNDSRLTIVVIIFLIELTFLTSIAFVLLY